MNPSRPSHLLPRLAGSAFLAVLVLVTGAAPALAGDAPATAEVPALIGQAEADAIALLGERGFEARIEYVEDDVAPAGTVIGQEPKKGTELLRGSEIVLRIIGSAPIVPELPPGDGGDLPADPGADAQVEMPSLIGRDMHDAEALLAELGLVAHPILVANPGGPAFRVLTQERPAGALLTLGTIVHFNVARPIETPTTVRVPHLKGLSEADAVTLLQNLGLSVRVRRQTSNWPVGQVYSQFPNAGQDVALGHEIRIRVALAPPQPVKVSVPDVRGMTKPQARIALLAHGLLYQWDRSMAPNKDVDRVFSQSRAPGSQVLPGTRITLRLPKYGFVPNVVGKSKNAARALIEGKGFQDWLVGPAAGIGVPTVQSQDPAAGTKLALGSKVRANYIFKPIIVTPLKVKVPNLKGKTLTQAKDLLQAKGLQWQFLGPINGVGTKVVKAQSKAAGTKVLIGTKILLTYEYKLVIIGNPVLQMRQVPQVKGLTINQAKQKLQQAGLGWEIVGFFGNKVKKQYTEAGKMVLKGTKIKLRRGP